MTTILALDTSSDACSVALWLDGQLEARFEISPRSHTQRLLPMVDDLMRQTETSPEAIDAIAFGAGPGSFTGLRICLGVVQGLAFGWGCKVIPISTLVAMALGARDKLQLTAGQSILVAMDARMSEVYAGYYRVTEQGIVALADDAVLAPNSVADYFSVADCESDLVAVGPGWHYQDMPSVSGSELNLEWHPQAAEVAILAAEAYERGEGVEAMQAEPIYLRNTVSWQKRQKKRQP